MNALKSTLQCLWAIVIFIFLFPSCQKDNDFHLNTIKKPGLEKQFFEVGYIERVNPNVADQMNAVEVRSQNVLNQAYDALILENKRKNFTGFIIEQYGFPAWGAADYNMSQDGEDLFIGIPLMFEHTN